MKREKVGFGYSRIFITTTLTSVETQATDKHKLPYALSQ